MLPGTTFQVNGLDTRGTFRLGSYEIALNFNGVPFELIPRAASEIKMKSKSKFVLLSVNEAEETKNPGRRLVSKSRSHWQLTNHGTEFLELLTY